MDSAALVTALKAQVLTLEDDLRMRVDRQPEVAERWRAEHRRVVEAERTASTWSAWRDDRVTQAAVAWALTSVFVRFCEDNALVAPVWIAGPTGRRQEALDGQLSFFRSQPEATDREWLLQSIEHLRQLPATAGLVDDRSPLWTVSPSGDAVTALLSFWRERGADGALRWDFADAEWSTRFLGDLYQDLSDHAKKTFALLQTPDFVEEFILDQTMEPALAERPLDGFTMIDPTCGSGHFLLGAFDRLLDRWERQAPAMEPQLRVQQALNAVHGVDINPFAVAIARFRLTVAALRACGLTSLEQAPDFECHVAAGDSLLFGHSDESLAELGRDDMMARMAYAVEDINLLKAILVPNRYDLVVGNPPYITVKDDSLNRAYRKLYRSCKGKYALTVPFMERFFELAKRGGSQPAGWVGQITSNSFMKREFGSKLIEDFLVELDLRLIADTSGVYLPGHGTPTVIITGRHQGPVGSHVRTVLGIRGEFGRPIDPALGAVWQSIVRNLHRREWDDDWVSIRDLDREVLRAHPWSLSGGAAASLRQEVSANASARLSDKIADVGFSDITGDDDAFLVPSNSPMRRALSADTVPFVEGDLVRDYDISTRADAIFPMSWQGVPVELGVATHRYLWRLRARLESRLYFGRTAAQRKLRWFDHAIFQPGKHNHTTILAFAFVATHGHFALDRGGRLFNKSAPVIKLPEGASEEDHLGLLGVLNSSTACFWLKQNSYPKGGDPVGDDGARVSQQPWSDRYEFTGTTLQDFPLPESLPLTRGSTLDGLAQRLGSVRPETVASQEAPTQQFLLTAHREFDVLRGQLIAQQEELDWEVYGLYGLPGGELVYTQDDLPELQLGQRAFEIALARKLGAGEEETAWFARHGSTPITEIPAHWPEAYREVVQRRLDLMEADPAVALLESPEHKRRWASESWDTMQERALRDWLLQRLEDHRFWFVGPTPTPRSVGQLADEVARDEDLRSVLALWEGRPDVPVVKSLTRLLADEAVPFLAAYRLKEPGLRKFEDWQSTWELQRREDAGEQVSPIPVPPKYTSADFRPGSWRHRGKLDVPKERFILYPEAGRSTDPTPLLGWAGWNHAEQSLALSSIITERESEGRPDEDFIPLVAGLSELQPWVEQWHADVDPRYGVSLAAFCREQLSERSRQVDRSVEQLAAWRPPALTRGRKRKTAATPEPTEEATV